MAQEPHGHDGDPNRQAEQRGAQTPQRDHTPRQEEAHAREEREQQTRGRRAAAPAVDEKAEARRRDAMAAASIGSQVILDFNDKAALGARGGAGGSIVENTIVRDEGLVEMGLDPVDTTGPLPSPEMVALRRKRAEEAAKDAAEGPLPNPPQASRASSLAAGIDLPKPGADKAA